MSDNELNQVVGGTVAQLEDLAVALAEKDKFLIPGTKKIGSHIPGANIALAYRIEEILKKQYTITANISVGILGTGWNSSDNQYFDYDGREMSHDEVMSIVKNSYGRIVTKG